MRDLKPAGTRYVVCIDPGVWRCGLAVFEAGELIYASEPEDTEHIGCVSRILVREAEEAINARCDAPRVEYISETPQDYFGKGGREGTLEQLRETVDRVRLWRHDGGSSIKLYLPRKWKGQVPKDIHQNRIVALLGPYEALLVRSLPRARDALDAIGLGLYHLARCSVGGKRWRT